MELGSTKMYTGQTHCSLSSSNYFNQLNNIYVNVWGDELCFYHSLAEQSNSYLQNTLMRYTHSVSLSFQVPIYIYTTYINRF